MELRNEPTTSTIAFFERLWPGVDPNLPLSKPKKTWRHRARCKDVPAEDIARIFFREDEPRRTKIELAYEEASEICSFCPVWKECRDEAINEEGRHQYGYRGRMDHKQRRQLYYDRKYRNEINPTYRPGDGVVVSKRKTT